MIDWKQRYRRITDPKLLELGCRYNTTMGKDKYVFIPKNMIDSGVRFDVYDEKGKELLATDLYYSYNELGNTDSVTIFKEVK